MSGDDVAARERALARRYPFGPARDAPVVVGFTAGGNSADAAPPLPWLMRTWRPEIATAFRAGRRAARAYARAQARSIADA